MKGPAYYCQIPSLVSPGQVIDMRSLINSAAAAISFGAEEPSHSTRIQAIDHNLTQVLPFVSAPHSFAVVIRQACHDPSYLLSVAEYIAGNRYGVVRRALRTVSYDIRATVHWKSSSVVLHGTAPFSGYNDLEAGVVTAVKSSLRDPVYEDCTEAIKSADLMLKAMWVWPGLDLVEMAADWLAGGGSVGLVPFRIRATPSQLSYVLSESHIGVLKPSSTHPE